MSLSNAVRKVRHGRSRLAYFAGHAARLCIPRFVLAERRRALFDSLSADERRSVEARAQYYNRCDSSFEVAPHIKPLRAWSIPGQHNYHLDLLDQLRWFPDEARVAYQFGDIGSVQNAPTTPTIVKARPLALETGACVLLKLNHVRHFHFVRDRRAFSDKRDRVVWRGHAGRDHRVRFLERFFGHPLCDVGQVGRRGAQLGFSKPFLSVREQLENKFVLSIEGNDVATNLKWILSSNSLCFMRKPRFETWFMEGTLRPEVHYVGLEDDHADLEEKALYYASRPEAAERILASAQRFVDRFRNPVLERCTSLLVLQRYLECSGQATRSESALARGSFT